MTLREFLDWCSDHGTGIGLFMIFVVAPLLGTVGSTIVSVFKAAVRRPACPQCGWPDRVERKTNENA